MPNIKPLYVFLEEICNEQRREAVLDFLERAEQCGYDTEHGIPTGLALRHELRRRELKRKRELERVESSTKSSPKNFERGDVDAVRLHIVGNVKS